MSDNEQTGLSRRAILAGGTAGVLGLSAIRAGAQEAEGQPLLGNPQLPEPEGQRMRWAIVGLGTYAVGQIMPAFGSSRLSRMTAFVSGNPDKARTLGERYGVSRFYSYDNYDDIARDDEIDCVFIALPVGLHAEYTIRALEAGKHVLCEKPMASTSAECEAMVEAAKKADRRLGVGYRVHFEPTNREAQRRIAAGDLGALRHIRAEHGFDANPEWPPHKWRLEQPLAGGGSMYDIGIYGLNTSLMMLDGDNPVSVSALYAYPREDERFSEVEGGLDWRMTMASGLIVSGSSSYCYRPFASRQAYLGSQASITMPLATTYYDNRLVLEDGGRREIGAGSPASQFAGQLDGFGEAVRAGRPHRTPGEMGLRDLRLIEAMYRSANEDGLEIPV